MVEEATVTRQRDRYGRPLGNDADSDEVFPGVVERTFIEASEAWAQALNYLDRDLPFHAHETFEQRWKCAPHDERPCWKALAQWGAALTHRARGNTKGARSVAHRAQHGLLAAPVIPAVVHIELVLESCADLQR